MVACATKPACVLVTALEFAAADDGNLSSPVDGRTRPAAILSKVVFPEPLRPASATHSPGSDFQTDATKRCEATVAFFNIFKANARWQRSRETSSGLKTKIRMK